MRVCGTTAATAPGLFAMFASRLVRRQRLSMRLLGALSLRTVLLGVIPALLAVVGLALYLLSGRYVGTDNAFIGAQKVLITPEVSGKVVSIAVVEGQALRRGDELLSIDPAPYRFAAEEALALLRDGVVDSTWPLIALQWLEMNRAALRASAQSG